jgi:hypothetical protein
LNTTRHHVNQSQAVIQTYLDGKYDPMNDLYQPATYFTYVYNVSKHQSTPSTEILAIQTNNIERDPDMISNQPENQATP